MEKHRDEATPLTTRTGVRIGGNFDREKMPALDANDKWVQSALLSPPIATIRYKRRIKLATRIRWGAYLIAACAFVLWVALRK